LGFTREPTTDEIYAKAKELGLELCPAEVGPHLRLQYENQPSREWLYIAMQQISDRGGAPGVFRLVRDGGGLWLAALWVYPVGRWGLGIGFVFVLRK